jgi:4a-hydroxytetrahydrobiopterin dehydratase
MSDAMTPSQFMNGAGTDWRIVSDGAVAFYSTTSLAESARFAAAIGDIEGVDGHPPAIDIRPGGVSVRTVTWRADHGGMTQRDLDLAKQVSEAADRLGLKADPTQVQSVLVIPGAPDIKAVTPFWRAILGYEPRPDSPEEDLVDPGDRGPAFWFETMDEPRADGGGSIHIAVWLPYELAQARVDAALASGGRMVRDRYAPAWWTLADAYGNEVDISTVNARD